MGVQLTKQSIDLGIVTTNGAAMLEFYRDLVGLKYLREMPMAGGKGVMHQLAAGDTMIKIVVLDETPAKAAEGGIQGATGYRYWTLTVSNLTEMLQAVFDKGHKVVTREREIRPGVAIGIVEDPDGNWLEFLQITPKPKAA